MEINFYHPDVNRRDPIVNLPGVYPNLIGDFSNYLKGSSFSASVNEQEKIKNPFEAFKAAIAKTNSQITSTYKPYTVTAGYLKDIFKRYRFYSPYIDLEESHALSQGTLSKLVNGGVKTAANLLGGIVEAPLSIIDLPSVVFGLNYSTVGEVDKLLENLDNVLPNYVTHWEKQHPILAALPFSSGFANTWFGRIMPSAARVMGNLVGVMGLEYLTGGLATPSLLGEGSAISRGIGSALRSIKSSFGLLSENEKAINDIVRTIDRISTASVDVAPADEALIRESMAKGLMPKELGENLLNGNLSKADFFDFKKAVNALYGDKAITWAGMQVRHLLNDYVFSLGNAQEAYAATYDKLVQDYKLQHFGQDPTGDDLKEIEDIAKGSYGLGLFYGFILNGIGNRIAFNRLGDLFFLNKFGQEKALGARFGEGLDIGLREGTVDQFEKKVVNLPPSIKLIQKLVKPLPEIAASGLYFSVGGRIIPEAAALQGLKVYKGEDKQDLLGLTFYFKQALKEAYKEPGSLAESILDAIGIGYLLHYGMNALTNRMNLKDRNKYLTYSLNLLNEKRIFGDIVKTFDKVNAEYKDEQKYKEALINGSPAEDLEIINESALHEWFDSAFNNNLGEYRKQQIEAIRRLSPDEFKKMVGLSSDIEVTNEEIGRFADKLQKKFNEIKDIHDKSEVFFKNPYVFNPLLGNEDERNLSYVAYEHLKEAYKKFSYLHRFDEDRINQIHENLKSVYGEKIGTEVLRRLMDFASNILGYVPEDEKSAPFYHGITEAVRRIFDLYSSDVDPENNKKDELNDAYYALYTIFKNLVIKNVGAQKATDISESEHEDLFSKFFTAVRIGQEKNAFLKIVADIFKARNKPEDSEVFRSLLQQLKDSIVKIEPTEQVQPSQPSQQQKQEKEQKQEEEQQEEQKKKKQKDQKEKSTKKEQQKPEEEEPTKPEEEEEKPEEEIESEEEQLNKIFKQREEEEKKKQEEEERLKKKKEEDKKAWSQRMEMFLGQDINSFPDGEHTLPNGVKVNVSTQGGKKVVKVKGKINSDFDLKDFSSRFFKAIVNIVNGNAPFNGSGRKTVYRIDDPDILIRLKKGEKIKPSDYKDQFDPVETKEGGAEGKRVANDPDGDPNSLYIHFKSDSLPNEIEIGDIEGVEMNPDINFSLLTSPEETKMTRDVEYVFEEGETPYFRISFTYEVEGKQKLQEGEIRVNVPDYVIFFDKDSGFSVDGKDRDFSFMDSLKGNPLYDEIKKVYDFYYPKSPDNGQPNIYTVRKDLINQLISKREEIKDILRPLLKGYVPYRNQVVDEFSKLKSQIDSGQFPPKYQMHLAALRLFEKYFVRNGFNALFNKLVSSPLSNVDRFSHLLTELWHVTGILGDREGFFKSFGIDYVSYFNAVKNLSDKLRSEDLASTSHYINALKDLVFKNNILQKLFDSLMYNLEGIDENSKKVLKDYLGNIRKSLLFILNNKDKIEADDSLFLNHVNEFLDSLYENINQLQFVLPDNAKFSDLNRLSGVMDEFLKFFADVYNKYKKITSSKEYTDVLNYIAKLINDESILKQEKEEEKGKEKKEEKESTSNRVDLSHISNYRDSKSRYDKSGKIIDGEKVNYFWKSGSNYFIKVQGVDLFPNALNIPDFSNDVLLKIPSIPFNLRNTPFAANCLAGSVVFRFIPERYKAKENYLNTDKFFASRSEDDIKKNFRVKIINDKNAGKYGLSKLIEQEAESNLSYKKESAHDTRNKNVQAILKGKKSVHDEKVTSREEKLKTPGGKLNLLVIVDKDGRIVDKNGNVISDDKGVVSEDKLGQVVYRTLANSSLKFEDVATRDIKDEYDREVAALFKFRKKLFDEDPENMPLLEIEQISQGNRLLQYDVSKVKSPDVKDRSEALKIQNPVYGYIESKENIIKALRGEDNKTIAISFGIINNNMGIAYVDYSGKTPIIRWADAKVNRIQLAEKSKNELYDSIGRAIIKFLDKNTSYDDKLKLMKFLTHVIGGCSDIELKKDGSSSIIIHSQLDRSIDLTMSSDSTPSDEKSVTNFIENLKTLIVYPSINQDLKEKNFIAYEYENGKLVEKTYQTYGEYVLDHNFILTNAVKVDDPGSVTGYSFTLNLQDIEQLIESKSGENKPVNKNKVNKRQKKTKSEVEKRIIEKSKYYYDLLDEIEREFDVKAYIVGGFARDAGLGADPKDVDIVIIPRDPEKSFEKLRQKTETITPAQAFPVFRFKSSNEKYKDETFELALARKEYKVGEGHKGFEITPADSIETDLQRRDFTVNAIAVDKRGRIYSPDGALKDLEDRVLRPVSAQHFVEDPLRYFRALRFATKGFELSPEMIDVMNRIPVEELETIPGERLYGELLKVFSSKHPEKFFEFLSKLDNVPSKFKWVKDALEVPPGKDKHEGEAHLLDHLNNVLTRAVSLSTDWRVRVAAFFHDIGKLKTNPEKWPSHHNHEKLGAAYSEEILKDLKFDKETIELTKRAAKEHMNIDNYLNLKPTTLFKIVSENAKYIDQMAIVSAADTWEPGFLEDLQKVVELAKKIHEMKPSSLIPKEKMDEYKKTDPTKIKGIVYAAKVERFKKELQENPEYNNTKYAKKLRGEDNLATRQEDTFMNKESRFEKGYTVEQLSEFSPEQWDNYLSEILNRKAELTKSELDQIKDNFNKFSDLDKETLAKNLSLIYQDKFDKGKVYFIKLLLEKYSINKGDEDLDNSKKPNILDDSLFREVPVDPEQVVKYVQQTQEEINRALEWGKKNLPQFSVEFVDDLIKTSSGGSAWGSMSRGIIKIYQRAATGTIYHEYYEGAFRYFTTPRERVLMYREFKNRKGTFVDRITGREIAYKDADFDTFRERIMDEASEYMLTGKIPVESEKTPFIKRFIQKLFDILRFVVHALTGKDIRPGEPLPEGIFEKVTSPTIEDFFENVASGRFAGEEFERFARDVDEKEVYREVSEDDEIEIAKHPQFVSSFINSMMHYFYTQVIKDPENIYSTTGVEVNKSIYDKIRAYMLADMATYGTNIDSMMESVENQIRNANPDLSEQELRKLIDDSIGRLKRISLNLVDYIEMLKDEKNWKYVIDKHAIMLKNRGIRVKSNTDSLEDLNKAIEEDNQTGRSDFDEETYFMMDYVDRASAIIKLLASSFLKESKVDEAYLRLLRTDKEVSLKKDIELPMRFTTYGLVDMETPSAVITMLKKRYGNSKSPFDFLNRVLEDFKLTGSSHLLILLRNLGIDKIKNGKIDESNLENMSASQLSLLNQLVSFISTQNLPAYGLVVGEDQGFSEFGISQSESKTFFSNLEVEYRIKKEVVNNFRKIGLSDMSLKYAENYLVKRMPTTNVDTQGFVFNNDFVKSGFEEVKKLFQEAKNNDNVIDPDKSLELFRKLVKSLNINVEDRDIYTVGSQKPYLVHNVLVAFGRLFRRLTNRMANGEEDLSLTYQDINDIANIYLQLREHDLLRDPGTTYTIEKQKQNRFIPRNTLYNTINEINQAESSSEVEKLDPVFSNASIILNAPNVVFDPTGKKIPGKDLKVDNIVGLDAGEGLRVKSKKAIFVQRFVMNINALLNNRYVVPFLGDGGTYYAINFGDTIDNYLAAGQDPNVPIYHRNNPRLREAIKNYFLNEVKLAEEDRSNISKSYKKNGGGYGMLRLFRDVISATDKNLLDEIENHIRNKSSMSETEYADKISKYADRVVDLTFDYFRNKSLDGLRTLAYAKVYNFNKNRLYLIDENGAKEFLEREFSDLPPAESPSYYKEDLAPDDFGNEEVKYDPYGFIQDVKGKGYMFDILSKLFLKQFIYKNEFYRLFYGDPYQYTKITKRGKIFNSPRIYVSRDDVMDRFLESKFNQLTTEPIEDEEEGKYYKYELQIDPTTPGYYKFKPYMKTVTVKDHVVLPKFVFELQEALKDPSLDDDTRKKIQDIISTYENNEKSTDGFSFMSLPAYRALMMRMGRWRLDGDTEKYYQKDMAMLRQELDKRGIWKYPNTEGGKVLKSHDEKVIKAYKYLDMNMSVIKPLIVGKEFGTDLPRIIQDKTAMGILSFSIVKDYDNALDTYIRMLYSPNEQTGKLEFDPIDYVIFDSGRKNGAPIDQESLYNDDGTIPTTALDKDQITWNGKGEMPTPFKNIQKVKANDFAIIVETSKEKDFFTRSRQLLNMAILNNYDKGQPLSDKQRELVDNYHTASVKLQEAKFNQMVEKLGLEYDKDKDAYNIKDPVRLRNTIMDMITSYDLPVSILDAFNLQQKEDGTIDFKYSFDMTPVSSKIREAIYSILDTNILHPHLNGGQKIQIPSMMFYKGKERPLAYKNEKGEWVPVKREDLDKLTPEERKTVRMVSEGRLETPIIKDGKIVGLNPSKFLLTPWFLEEAVREYGNIPLDKLMEKIAPEDRERILQAVSFRIPYQNKNFFTVAKIESFLDRSYKNNVIIPEESGIKSGTDYDVDKQNMQLDNVYIGKDGLIHRVPYFPELDQEEAIKKYEEMIRSGELLPKHKFDKINRLVNVIKGLFYNTKTKSRDIEEVVLGNMTELTEKGMKYLQDNIFDILKDTKDEIKKAIKKGNISNKSALYKLYMGYTNKQPQEKLKSLVKHLSVADVQILTGYYLDALHSLADEFNSLSDLFTDDQARKHFVELHYNSETGEINVDSIIRDLAFDMYVKGIENHYKDTLADLYLNEHDIENKFNSTGINKELDEEAKRMSEIMGNINEGVLGDPLKEIYSGVHASRNVNEVGFAVIPSVNHSLAQRIGLTYDLKLLQESHENYSMDTLQKAFGILLPHNDQGNFVTSLSSLNNVDGQSISSVMSYFIDKKVDAPNTDEATTFNTYGHMSNVASFLARAGVPPVLITRYVSQPINRLYNEVRDELSITKPITSRRNVYVDSFYRMIDILMSTTGISEETKKDLMKIKKDAKDFLGNYTTLSEKAFLRLIGFANKLLGYNKEQKFYSDLANPERAKEVLLKDIETFYDPQKRMEMINKKQYSEFLGRQLLYAVNTYGLQVVQGKLFSMEISFFPDSSDFKTFNHGAKESASFLGYVNHTIPTPFQFDNSFLTNPDKNVEYKIYQHFDTSIDLLSKMFKLINRDTASIFNKVYRNLMDPSIYIDKKDLNMISENFLNSLKTMIFQNANQFDKNIPISLNDEVERLFFGRKGGRSYTIASRISSLSQKLKHVRDERKPGNTLNALTPIIPLLDSLEFELVNSGKRTRHTNIISFFNKYNLTTDEITKMFNIMKNHYMTAKLYKDLVKSILYLYQSDTKAGYGELYRAIPIEDIRDVIGDIVYKDTPIDLNPGTNRFIRSLIDEGVFHRLYDEKFLVQQYLSKIIPLDRDVFSNAGEPFYIVSGQGTKNEKVEGVIYNQSYLKRREIVPTEENVVGALPETYNLIKGYLSTIPENDRPKLLAYRLDEHELSLYNASMQLFNRAGQFIYPIIRHVIESGRFKGNTNIYKILRDSDGNPIVDNGYVYYIEANNLTNGSVRQVPDLENKDYYKPYFADPKSTPIAEISSYLPVSEASNVWIQNMRTLSGYLGETVPENYDPFVGRLVQIGSKKFTIESVDLDKYRVKLKDIETGNVTENNLKQVEFLDVPLVFRKDKPYVGHIIEAIGDPEERYLIYDIVYSQKRSVPTYRLINLRDNLLRNIPTANITAEYRLVYPTPEKIQELIAEGKIDKDTFVGKNYVKIEDFYEKPITDSDEIANLAKQTYDKTKKDVDDFLSKNTCQDKGLNFKD